MPVGGGEPNPHTADHQPLLQTNVLQQDATQLRRMPETLHNRPSYPVSDSWGQGLISWILRGQTRNSSNDLQSSLTPRSASASSNDVERPLLSNTNPGPAHPGSRPIQNSISSHSIDALPSSLSTSGSLPHAPRPAHVTEIVASLHSRSSSIDSTADRDPCTAKGVTRTPSTASLASITRTNSSGSAPQCMICLEPLLPEDFDSGEAIVLECLCKGDNALRHKSCALKWLEFKGDRTCDVCKTPIGNLPDPPPRPMSPPHAIALQLTDPMDDMVDALSPPEAAAAADHVFDTIRVTWVAMIFCILFFQMSVGQAFLIGAAVGMLYTTVCMVVHRYCQHQSAQELAALQQEGPERA